MKVINIEDLVDEIHINYGSNLENNLDVNHDLFLDNDK